MSDYDRRFADFVAAFRAQFGDRAASVAEAQLAQSTGEARVAWVAIVEALRSENAEAVPTLSLSDPADRSP